jgi:hypothetical protein
MTKMLFKEKKSEYRKPQWFNSNVTFPTGLPRYPT